MDGKHFLPLGHNWVAQNKAIFDRNRIPVINADKKRLIMFSFEAPEFVSREIFPPNWEREFDGIINTSYMCPKSNSYYAVA